MDRPKEYVSPSQFAALETQVENIATNLQTLTQNVSNLANSISVSNKWDWRAIFAGVSILLTVIFAVGGMSLTPLYLMSRYNEIERHNMIGNIGDNVTLLREHEVKISTHYATTQERLNQLQKELEWQRELFKMTVAPTESL